MYYVTVAYRNERGKPTCDRISIGRLDEETEKLMDIIRKVQAEYRLPEKARTIGEMLAEARQQSGAQKLSGHDIMALERFDPATRHMIVFDVLTHDSPVGWKGEKTRLFLTDTGYSKALENQEKGHIKVRSHARYFPAISTMTIKTVRGSRPQNVSKSVGYLLFLPPWLAF